MEKIKSGLLKYYGLKFGHDRLFSKSMLMLSVFFILFILIIPQSVSAATYYVDSVNGSDTNNGTSISAPWKTISKVNDATLNPGDEVLFKRGDIWEGNNSNTLIVASGSSDGYITYGAYGTGSKPVLTTAVTRNKTSDWENKTGNIWVNSDNAGITEGSEKLLNPSFDTDLSNWFTYLNLGAGVTGSAERTTTSGEFYSAPAGYKLTVSTSSASSNDIQFGTTHLSIESGKYYKFSFYAKSDNEFSATISLFKESPPYTLYYSNAPVRVHTITTSWKKYTIYFKASKTVSDARINFSLGLIPNNSVVYLDDMSFKEVSVSGGFLDSDVGNIIMENKSIFGVKVWKENDLTAQGDYWYDLNNHALEMYSTQNPADFYHNDITLVLRNMNIEASNKKYNIFTGLGISMGGALGISMHNSDHMIIKNCDFSYIGGGDQYMDGIHTVRYGNAVQLWNAGHDIDIYNNKIWQIYDDAVTPQGSSTSNIYNIYIYNNIIWNSEYGLAFWERPEDTTVNNIHFENNSIIKSGGGWAHNQRPDGVNGRAFIFWSNPAILTNIFIRNNIAYDSTESAIRTTDTDWFSKLNLDYNHYSKSGTLIDIYSPTYKSYASDELNSWRLDSGKDLHSIAATAYFNDYAKYNFKLSSNSPDIDAGTYISYRTKDFAGNPIYGAPDIGAYEYQPPYAIGTNNIPTTGSIRIYGDGKYRMKTASSSSAKASFSVTPVGGKYLATTTQFMDITIDKWNTTGNKNKEWTASSATGEFKTHATSTVYTVGDLMPNTYYQFKIDGTASTTAVTGSACNSNGECLSDSSGQIIFKYIGGYSTHTFALDKYTDAPSTFNLLGEAKAKLSNSSKLSWNKSSSDIGIAKYRLYVDGAIASDNIPPTSTSVSVPTTYKCNESHEWSVMAVDNNGNTTSSDKKNFNIPCGDITPVSTIKKTATSTSALIDSGTEMLGKVAHTRPSTKQKTATPKPTLTNAQVSAIISILKSFGVDADIIKKVESTLGKTQSIDIPVYKFMRNLNLGDVGARVKKLQTFLNSHGYLVSDTGYGAPGHETTYFGRKTYRALVRYQKSKGLPATGWFGPMTRASI